MQTFQVTQDLQSHGEVSTSELTQKVPRTSKVSFQMKSSFPILKISLCHSVGEMLFKEVKPRKVFAGQNYTVQTMAGSVSRGYSGMTLSGSFAICGREDKGMLPSENTHVF